MPKFVAPSRLRDDLFFFICNVAFGFSEDERDRYLGGYIAAAFYLFGAPAAILFGYLSHTVSRRALFLLAVLLGEHRILRVFNFVLR